MATLKQVVDVLETLYPLRYAEQWDEPGLPSTGMVLELACLAFAHVQDGGPVCQLVHIVDIVFLDDAAARGVRVFAGDEIGFSMSTTFISEGAVI